MTPPKKEAPGATNTEGLVTTANEGDCATGVLYAKALATQIAQFAIRGHTVHKLEDGGFLVCKHGHTRYAAGFAELQAIACQLGVRHV